MYMIFQPPGYELYPEIEIPLPQHLFPGVRPIYIVSNYGYIYNIETGQCTPRETYKFDRNDYMFITFQMLNGESYRTNIHRIILMTFGYIPGCEELECNHKDGIKCHNWLWNLEWMTHRENLLHAFDNNLVTLGEDRDNSILTNEQAHVICQLIQDGYSTKEICNILQYDFCDLRRTVTNIKNGHCWSHISKLYDFSNAFSVKRTFTEEQIHSLCLFYQTNGRNSITMDNVMRMFGIEPSLLSEKERRCYYACISSIKNKKIFKEICDQYNY